MTACATMCVCCSGSLIHSKLLTLILTFLSSFLFLSLHWRRRPSRSLHSGCAFCAPSCSVCMRIGISLRSIPPSCSVCVFFAAFPSLFSVPPSTILLHSLSVSSLFPSHFCFHSSLIVHRLAFPLYGLCSISVGSPVCPLLFARDPIHRLNTSLRRFLLSVFSLHFAQLCSFSSSLPSSVIFSPIMSISHPNPECPCSSRNPNPQWLIGAISGVLQQVRNCTLGISVASHQILF